MTNNSKWVYKNGQTKKGIWENIIDLSTPNWDYASLKTTDLKNNKTIQFNTKNTEQIVLPLSGGCEIKINNKIIKLDGRKNVFNNTTDICYIGPDTTVEITGHSRLALCGAFADPSVKLPSPVYLSKDKVEISVKGAGNMSRVIRNFGTPEVLEAQNVIACEGYVPNGNWGSYPPHKHDEELKGIESELVEIYYFELRTDKSIINPKVSFPHGYHAVSSSDNRDINVLTEIHNKDIVLVPFGWHGPSMAAPGYDLYFLNSMAGPGRERIWNITNHPEHKWLVKLWEKLEIDPRLRINKNTKLNFSNYS